MMSFILLLVFLAFGALVWFHGLWGAAITLVNLIVAMLFATNLFEPICNLIEVFESSFTYLLDFVVLWFLFFFSYGILRLITDLLSRTRVKFDLPVEMAGRSVLAIWCGWLMVCFTAFTLQTAPLNSESPLGAWKSPQAGSFLGMAPGRMWLGFAHSRSRGALARGNYSGNTHPDDVDLNVEAFDPHGEFPIKYHDRRVKYAAEGAMRVAQ
ncbi:MAG: hypothetical protein WD872_02295 [Pirellulaceae bacterium]